MQGNSNTHSSSVSTLQTKTVAGQPLVGPNEKSGEKGNTKFGGLKMVAPKKGKIRNVGQTSKSILSKKKKTTALPKNDSPDEKNRQRGKGKGSLKSFLVKGRQTQPRKRQESNQVTRLYSEINLKKINMDLTEELIKDLKIKEPEDKDKIR
eukprot:15348212-Ditylum_brightwellii.AAC.2